MSIKNYHIQDAYSHLIPNFIELFEKFYPELISHIAIHCVILDIPKKIEDCEFNIYSNTLLELSQMSFYEEESFNITSKKVKFPLTFQEILRVLNNPIIANKFELRKKSFINKIEEAKNYTICNKLVVEAFGKDRPFKNHKTLFSSEQSFRSISKLEKLAELGKSGKELQNIFLEDTLFEESTTILKLLLSDTEEEYDEMMFSVFQRISSIFPLLESILQSLHRKKQFFLFSTILKKESQYFTFAFSIPTTYYKKNQKLFFDENTYLENEYTSFIIQCIKISLNKAAEILSSGISIFSTINDIADSNAIINLAVRDITLGRRLPNFKYLNILSAMPYEGIECKGQIAFINKENSTLEFTRRYNIIKFSTYVAINDKNMRYIRKLLELSGNKVYLICNHMLQIIGFSNQLDTSKIHVVKFDGFMKWELLYDNKELISYKEELFYIKHLLKKDINKKNISFIVDAIILELRKQQHGTMVIVFNKKKHAINESERLNTFNRCIKFEEPIDLSQKDKKSYILKISSIDGALILDNEGNCYGIGAIIDGKASVKGDTSRGARFNSAKNYFENIKKRRVDCTVFVISEDGDFDCLSTMD